MKVLIDATNCAVGGGAAARHLLRALDGIDSTFEITALAPAGEAFRMQTTRLRVVQLPPGTSAQWWKRGLTRSRAAAGIGEIDIYHGLTCQAPPKGVRARFVLTSFTTSNPYTPRLQGWSIKDRIRFAVLRKRFRASLERATHVVVHTEAARSLLRQVVPLGSKPVLVHRLAVDGPAGFRYDPRLRPESCILCPSSYLPHKNLERLLRAYDLCRRTVEAPPLVVAGFAPEPYRSRLERVRRSLNSAAFIQLLCEQGGAEMADLYRRALAVVVPSYEETFSLPVVEAIVSGIPVLCSDPGDSHWLPYREFEPGLIYWDPFDTGSIAAGLLRVLSSEEERRHTSAVLRANTVPRSWSDYAHQLLQCYLELVPAGSPSTDRQAQFVR